MTEGTERALETTAAGVLFCMAITMLILLHTVLNKQIGCLGWQSDQLILFEEIGGGEWKHLDE